MLLRIGHLPLLLPYATIRAVEYPVLVVLRQGLEMPKRQLADYLTSMQTDDVLAATDEAKVQARTLLEDQGITILALMLADFLADTIWQGKLDLPESVLARTAALS